MEDFACVPLTCYSLPGGKHFHGGVSMNLTDDNDVLIAYGGYGQDGRNLYLLKNLQKLGDPDWEEEWQEVKLTSGRCAHASKVINNKLYVHGGYGANGGKGEFHAWSSLEEIDLTDFTCREITYNSVIANVERRWHCSFVRDNKFFVHGGWNDGGPLDDMLFFDLDQRDWQKVSFPEGQPAGRRWHSLVQIDNEPKYLMFGGFSGDKKTLHSDLHVLNMERISWNELNPSGTIPTPRCKHDMCQIGSKQFLLLGGEYNQGSPGRDSSLLHLDDMSWRPIKNNKELHQVNRPHVRLLKATEFTLIVAGGMAGSYVSPFFFLDTRMLQI